MSHLDKVSAQWTELLQFDNETDQEKKTRLS